MKTRFICNASNARLLRNRIDKCEGFEAEYVVERVVYLSKREFIPFRERLLEDEPNIAKYQDDMFIDENDVFHVLSLLLRFFEGFEGVFPSSFLSPRTEQSIIGLLYYTA